MAFTIRQKLHLVALETQMNQYYKSMQQESINYQLKHHTVVNVGS